MSCTCIGFIFQQLRHTNAAIAIKRLNGSHVLLGISHTCKSKAVFPILPPNTYLGVLTSASSSRRELCMFRIIQWPWFLLHIAIPRPNTRLSPMSIS